MKSSEHTESVWKATEPLRQYPPLSGEASADVCIVGAGIAGMSVAYQLARQGKRVIVVDDNAVGGGETGQTTAHLASALDDRFSSIEKVFGKDGARTAYESHQAAIDTIAEVAEREGIDCDYQRLDGYLFLAAGQSADRLDDELKAAHRAGFGGVERLARAPITTFNTGPCLRFPLQAQFHPLRYVNGLADAVLRLGGTIYTGNHVSGIEAGERPRVEGDGFAIQADALVIATNSPISDLFAVHTKQAPYRTFAIAGRIPEAAVPTALYWDDGDPYHYVRTQNTPDGLMLIVGGEDFKTGHADDAVERWRCLEEWTRQRFPLGEVTARWSGQVMEPVDYMGFIGRDPGGHENVYVATGDSGQGMTHGTIAGLLIADLILGRPNSWEALYDPSRMSLRPGPIKEFVKENADVAVQYTDLLKGGEVADEHAIARGCGAIVKRGLKPVAIYRDDEGVLHERSGLCTHLQCVVRWNSAERSWDCPCHGSRFAPTGEVLNGPALAPLASAEER